MVIFYMFKKCFVLNLFYDLFFANYVPIKRRVISEFTAKKTAHYAYLPTKIYLIFKQTYQSTFKRTFFVQQS